MKCASALSLARETGTAIREVIDRVAEQLGGGGADLAVAFASADHAEGLGRLAAELRGAGLVRHLLACTGEAIVGGGREVEAAPALSLWAIRLPGVELRPIRLSFEDGAVEGWPGDLPDAPAGRRTLLVLGDPFTFPTDPWLKQLQAQAPGLPVLGGMASGGRDPGCNRLVLDDGVHDDGAVAMLIDGPVAVRAVVSQGCRPVGRPMLVTKVEGNLIRELGRRPALEVLREVFEGLSPEEQELASQGLHVGRVINEYRESFGRGDFLVRNVLGADESGAIAITDAVRVGQTVQFHVRDAETADEDLRTLLASARREAPPAGALLFTCNGRGTRLFPAPDHDASALRDLLGPIPVAGFFAMGEVGPVGGQNFVHGFTASVALFEEAEG